MSRARPPTEKHQIGAVLLLKCLNRPLAGEQFTFYRLAAAAVPLFKAEEIRRPYKDVTE